MSLVQGQILQKFGFLCASWAELGSQGFAVKCTAAIVFPTVGFSRYPNLARVSISK